MQPNPPPETTFKVLGLLHMGPFPSTSRGNKFYIAATDYLNKWTEVRAVPGSSTLHVLTLINKGKQASCASHRSFCRSHQRDACSERVPQARQQPTHEPADHMTRGRKVSNQPCPVWLRRSFSVRGDQEKAAASVASTKKGFGSFEVCLMQLLTETQRKRCVAINACTP
ncbi:hypothetical protein MRX96_006016 [Rhipicephalus microplus]